MLRVRLWYSTGYWGCYVDNLLGKEISWFAATAKLSFEISICPKQTTKSESLYCQVDSGGPWDADLLWLACSSWLYPTVPLSTVALVEEHNTEVPSFADTKFWSSEVSPIDGEFTFGWSWGFCNLLWLAWFFSFCQDFLVVDLARDDDDDDLKDVFILGCMFNIFILWIAHSDDFQR